MILYAAALTILWVLLTGDLTLFNFLVGFVASVAGLSFVRQEPWVAPYARDLRKLLRPGRILALFGFFAFLLKELALANAHVAYHVIAPLRRLTPGIVAFPLTVVTDEEITLLACLITLTPGTLSVDVSADRRVLFIHVLDLENVDAFLRSVADGFERRVAELFR